MREKLMSRKEFWRAQAMPEQYHLYKVVGDKVYIPMGILGTSWANKFPPHREDMGHLHMALLPFGPQLRDEQHQAIKNIMSRNVGLMNAGTGTGKSYMILYMAARNPYKTLIVVSSTVCLEEMVTKCQDFCGVTPHVIGGNTKYKPTTDKITVCMLHSVSKLTKDKKEYKLNAYDFGCILVDECDVTISTAARQSFFYRMSPEMLY